ncbi:T-lymphoma invasion and metastasis-inducing protein 1 [Goodea atripinnis]|uniref:T-lymphoma invasion and metastasis-inducing protein 1 n=1 Tax=Goodea atripinnis TaxID=208336 RepID=A0ABV0NHR8_9TELE
MPCGWRTASCRPCLNTPRKTMSSASATQWEMHFYSRYLTTPTSISYQTSGQTELENWITAIHSACATALARQHHREDTVRLLRTEIRKLEQKIDMDEKMKKMGDMQLSTVTDAKKRKTILEQVWNKQLR